MNFFEQQDQARKNTRRLILFFVLAVISLILLTNAFLILFPWELNQRAFGPDGSNQSLVCLLHGDCDFWATLNWPRITFVSISVPLIIAFVSLWKWLSIRQGGRKVAEMMGGTLLSSDTRNLPEKRLLNVVEEMALAANMPVPAVYVMPNEAGINAFAAGFSHKDAVVAVTQGTLESFNRDQLQGVVAHEFSHILNGDMRLNMHLIAVLHGIMFITEAGMIFFRGSAVSRRDSRGPTAMLGLGLIILGALGTFFANLIKAAVSRQREYLADASAVQFTRNPDGIADALKIIGGVSSESFIQDAHKSEVSHLFFARCTRWAYSAFATHPPIAERIQRIQPRWDGEYLQPGFSGQYNHETGRYDFEFDKKNENASSEGMDNQQKLSVLMAAVMTASVTEEVDGDKSGEPVETPLTVLHQTYGAAAALCCLLLPEEEHKREQLLEGIKHQWPELYQAVLSSPWHDAHREDFLEILELGTSALRLFSEQEYIDYKQILLRLIKADGQVHLYEWALYYSLRANLDSHFCGVKRNKMRYRTINRLETEMTQVIGKLIEETEQSEENKHKAFAKALNTCGFYRLQVDGLPAVKIHEFNLAIQKISQAYPLVKGRFIKALIDAVMSDGHVEILEKQTVLAIASAIESPVSEIGLQQLERKLP